MNTQFKKGVLELCVLSLLKNGDKYGYELADTVGKQIDVSEKCSSKSAIISSRSSAGKTPSRL